MADDHWSMLDQQEILGDERIKKISKDAKKNPTGIERKKKRSAITKLKTIQTGNSRLFIFYCHIALLESGSMFSLGYFVFIMPFTFSNLLLVIDFQSHACVVCINRFIGWLGSLIVTWHGEHESIWVLRSYDTVDMIWHEFCRNYPSLFRSKSEGSS